MTERDAMASSWSPSALVELLSSGADPDDAAHRLAADEPDPETLAAVAALVRVLAWDPSARDRAILLLERTRLLAERASRGAAASDRLRAEAERPRDADWVRAPSYGGVWRHELATPLSVAQLALETLATHRGDPNLTDQMLEVARRNLRLAAHLLDGLGSLEDLEAGRVTLSWSQVDMAELVRECVEDLSTVLDGQHELEVRSDRPVAAPADRSAVRQILVNLLTNAAKYSPPGSPIDVVVSASPDHVEVAVRDRGHGLEPQDAERIFEPGQRLDVEAPGKGLGLFIARQLARAHGGDLHVEQPLTGGSRFVLRLSRTPTEWQRSLERREEASRARNASADARDAALTDREATADQRDTTLTEREATADQRDTTLTEREATADERDTEHGRRGDA